MPGKHPAHLTRDQNPTGSAGSASNPGTGISGAGDGQGDGEQGLLPPETQPQIMNTVQNSPSPTDPEGGSVLTQPFLPAGQCVTLEVSLWHEVTAAARPCTNEEAEGSIPPGLMSCQSSSPSAPCWTQLLLPPIPGVLSPFQSQITEPGTPRAFISNLSIPPCLIFPEPPPPG